MNFTGTDHVDHWMKTIHWSPSLAQGAGNGVKAVSKDGAGLAALSTSNEAVHAETHSPGTAAIAAFNLNPEGTGAGVFALKEGTHHARMARKNSVMVARPLFH